jgi:hypothetical protein
MMQQLDRNFIRTQVADSEIIYKRGVSLYEFGAFALREADADKGHFIYDVDGNYGDYTTEITLSETNLVTNCDCPYPGPGCKHIVAALLNARDIAARWREAADYANQADSSIDVLSADEIRHQALEDRRSRSSNEDLRIFTGDMLKGEHLVETAGGTQYTVTLHDPQNGLGHCTCPDYRSNRLGTCKHMLFAVRTLKRKRGFAKKATSERFPFVDLYWDSVDQEPRLFHEIALSKDLRERLKGCFDARGRFCADTLGDLLPLLAGQAQIKQLRIQPEVLYRVDNFCRKLQLTELAGRNGHPDAQLKTDLYPYQKEGVRFGLFKPAALIGDEMGLGKTLQAIALAILKREIFGFQKVLVVTLASLKEQWKREINRFSDETALVVAGPPDQRRRQYLETDSLFKITNYEAVLRDGLILAHFKPDLVILDEAQRIKNFSTKTAAAVKQIPRKHSLVLTGTPLENKLEDVYSIVQFLDPHLLAPLWQFAADHFMLSRRQKGKILGYRNLDRLREKLQPIVLRRKKEEVLDDLPDQVVNNYYIDLHEKQRKMHAGYASALMPLLNKKYLTPMDLRRIQELLLRMRQVCNATYLVDRKTHISPKLTELEGIIDELVIQNQRKMVIFSEWTTMTFLIARRLSDAGIAFVELSGKIPVKKRQTLIDEFTNNPDCKVFLSTDAGGTGLNLQAADCVVNFELPWNPARLNQRVGRVNRIGQKSRCVNVVNLIAKESIEEKIMAGLQLKTDLFEGVFEGGADTVEFSQAKRTELLNRLRALIEEDPLGPAREAAAQEEIPEDTPHFLNPKALGKESDPLDVSAEEMLTPSTTENADIAAEGVSAAHVDTTGNLLADQSPEKLEQVLDNGLKFISGLLEMATGQKLTSTANDSRMVHIDPEKGEVVLKFKLPGF